ncbi:MAG: hypothetical protein QM539_10685 [Alphaproteobacteria bacterium]|nr:hypothetical protein [Alphaproteobacteria bacterium]
MFTESYFNHDRIQFIKRHHRFKLDLWEVLPFILFCALLIFIFFLLRIDIKILSKSETFIVAFNCFYVVIILLALYYYFRKIKKTSQFISVLTFKSHEENINMVSAILAKYNLPILVLSNREAVFSFFVQSKFPMVYKNIFIVPLDNGFLVNISEPFFHFFQIFDLKTKKLKRELQQLAVFQYATRGD